LTLSEVVAFIATEGDRVRVPQGYVAYTAAEFERIDMLPPESFLDVHAAKKSGAVVMGNYPDTPLEDLLQRLRKGSRWLATEYPKSLRDDYDDDALNVLAKSLATWDGLEKELRAVHSYRGCVLGDNERCDPDAPVVCDYCVADA